VRKLWTRRLVCGNVRKKRAKLTRANDQGIIYPVLLDPGRQMNVLFQIEGIPKTFVYYRDGKITTQFIDMRTQK
jgi:hypothetical protein